MEADKPILKTIKVEQGSGNVFADVGLPHAQDLQVKAELARRLHHRIKVMGLTQAEAARRLGLKQPDVSNLMRGRFTGFSIDRLIKLLNAVEVDVDIILRPVENHEGRRGKVRVMEAIA
jgi:predicted XRE-type DNA-binding protein